jgi:cell division protein FtsB
MFTGTVDPRQRHFIERALPLSVLVVAVASVPVMVFSPGGLDRLERLREERVKMQAEVRKLNREIRTLRHQVQRIKEEPAAVERVARDELGLIRRTEVVFQFSQ